MNNSLIGAPHTIQRYIAFGFVAGVLSGGLAIVFGLSLPFVALPAAAIVGWTAGLGRDDTGVPSHA
jgi:hypothetical protein